MNFYKLLLSILLGTFTIVSAQHDTLQLNNLQEKLKITHAEPLYTDLIRDLGARKGEKEWNIAVGILDDKKQKRYDALIEYEWAPVDRLGLEIELPFSFYSKRQNHYESPSKSQLNSLKLAAQWSFMVDEKTSTTMALGYINELEFSPFNAKNEPFIKGNVYNPFLVAAKRWGEKFHTLIYTGPRFIQEFQNSKFHMEYDINTNFHYTVGLSRNFVGLEINKTITNNTFTMTFRPQMRVEISKQLMIGLVTGIPYKKDQNGFSSFMRLIYEPKH